MTKRKFMIVYDYRMGGLWAMMKARTEDEITGRYPELEIVPKKPDWMSWRMYLRIRFFGEVFDIDEPPRGWLKDLRVND